MGHLTKRPELLKTSSYPAAAFALSVLLCLPAFSFAKSVRSDSAAEIGDKSISVIAEGTAALQPDRAVIKLHFTSYGWTVDKSRKKVDELVKKFSDKITAKGVKSAQIQVGEVRFKPSYQFNRDLKTNVPADFLVSRKVTLTLDDLADVEKVLDSSITTGSFLLESMTLLVKDKNALELSAFNAAVAEGKRKAGEIAKGLNMNLGGVASIQEIETEVHEMDLLQDDQFAASASGKLNAKEESGKGDPNEPTVMSGEGFLALKENEKGGTDKDAVQAVSRLRITFNLQ